MGITVSNSDSNYSVGVGSQPAVIPSPIQSLSPSVSSPPSPVVNVPVEKLSPRAQVDIRIGPKGAPELRGTRGIMGLQVRPVLRGRWVLKVLRGYLE